MAIHVDVVADLSNKSTADAARELTNKFSKMGTDAGRSMADNFSKAIEAGAPKVEKAMERAVTATGKLTVKTKELEKAQADATEQAKKVAQAEENAGKAMTSAGEESDAYRNALKALNDEREREHRLSVKSAALAAQVGQIRRDEASAMREVERSVSDFNDTNKAMTAVGSSATKSIADLGSSLRGLGGVATPLLVAGAVSGIGQLAGVAVTAAGTVGLLPGVLGAAGAAFGTLKLATIGFGEALDSIKDPEKFADALRELSPQAQQAAMSIRALMPAFDELRKTTQDAFFNNVGPQLNTLTSTLLPQVQSLTTGLAQGFNQAFMGTTFQLMSPETMASFQTFSQNVSVAFQHLAAAAAPFTSALMDIAAVGSSFLPQIGTEITKAATEFAEFIRQAQRTGEITEFIQDGIDVVKQLWPAVKNLVGAFWDLGENTKDSLPNIVSALNGMAAVLPSIVDAATDLTGPLTTVLSLVGNIETSSESMGETIQAAIKGATDAFMGLLSPIQAVVDAFQLFADPNSMFNKSATEALKEKLDKARAQVNAGVPVTGAKTPGPASAPSGVPGAPGVRPFPAGGYKLPSRNGVGWDGTRDNWLDHLRGGTAGFGGPGGGSRKTGSADDPSFGSVSGYGVLTRDDIERIARDQFGLTMTGDRLGESGSYHSVPGSAGDFSNGTDNTPQMEAFAKYMALNYGKYLKELIYTDPDFSGGQIKDGKFVPDSTYGKVAGEHRNHVHIAIDPKGIPADGMGSAANMDGYGRTRSVSVDNFGGDSLGQLGGQLADDMGLSEGIPGLVKFITTSLANMAFAPLLGSLEAIKQANGIQGGYGLMGIQGAQRIESMYPGASMGMYGGSAPWGGGGGFSMGMGMPSTGVVGSKQDTANLVYQMALQRGYSPHDAQSILAYAIGESGLNPGISGGPQGGGGSANEVIGLFQQKPAFAQGGGIDPSLRGDPAANTFAYLNQLEASRHLPIEQALPATSVGGPLSGVGAQNWPGLMNQAGGYINGMPGGMPGGVMYPGIGMPQSMPMAAGGNPFGGSPSMIQGAPRGGPSGTQGGQGPGLGGAPMAALSAAASGLDLLAPGAGQAAQTGIQMINRTIQFGGQAAAIAASGLLETFSLSGGSGLSDPMKTLPGRILAGLSGARPATPSSAGKTQQPGQPGPGAADPNSQQHGQGQGQPPGPLFHVENMNVKSPKDGNAVAGDAALALQGYDASKGAR